jgi:acyl-CoA synthetase (AMP-forming)/AMP-acid ligase II
MLSEVVAETSRRFGDLDVLSTGTGSITHSELQVRSEAVARQFTSLGIGRDSRVALAMPSGIAWVVGAVAADRVGALFAGISPVSSPPERAGMLDLLEPDLIVVDPDRARDVAATLPDPTMASRLLVLDDGLSEASSGLNPLRRWSPDSEPWGNEVGSLEVPTHDRGPDRPFAVCFTSGTTGAAKAALFTESAAVAVRDIDLGPQAASTWGGGAPMIASTQFAHVGFVLKFGWYLRLGSTVHVMDRWSASGAISLVEEHRMQALGVVAPQLALMLRSPAMEGADLSRLRLIIAGGAPSPEALITEACERLGVSYSVRWSSTESGGVGLAQDTLPGNPVSPGIGKPRPGVEARVADGNGNVARPGEEDELQVRSAAMMSAYLGSSEATGNAFTPDGWLRTGDLAVVDDHGNHILRGRSGDMYIRGGYNVHPTEVEAVLVEHPAVAAVAVVPRPDDVMGEIGVAFVVPTDPAFPPVLEDLRDFATDLLPAHKLPEDLRMVDRLPLTAAQKLDRLALLDTI